MTWLFGSGKTTMVTPDDAMPGRDHYLYDVPKLHAVLGTPLKGPWTPTTEVLYVGMGCFWGAERKFWQKDGVISTAVGYQGGFTPYPTYEETCTAKTGHTEAVLIAYEPDEISTYDILKTFWGEPRSDHAVSAGEMTSARSTEARSTGPTSTSGIDRSHQRRLCARTGGARVRSHLDRDRTCRRAGVLLRRGLPPAVPLQGPHGYDCHANTGIPLPPLG